MRNLNTLDKTYAEYEHCKTHDGEDEKRTINDQNNTAMLHE